MNGDVRIPRSRGSVCGVLLILLGLWGGLAPFVGPYFHFGLTPDTPWHYDSGRLIYSAIPGAAALIGGVLVVASRNRAVGIIGGVLGVLGGAWFVLGLGIVTDVLYRQISPGSTIVPSGVSYSLRADYLATTISLFTGLGVLILAAGAIAIGRFSMVAAKDVVTDSYEMGFPAAPDVTRPDLSQYPTTVGPSASVPPFEPAPFPDTSQIPPTE
jgi:hypothetical protein